MELRMFQFSFLPNGVRVILIDHADAPRISGTREAGGTLTGKRIQKQAFARMGADGSMCLGCELSKRGIAGGFKGYFTRE